MKNSINKRKRLNDKEWDLIEAIRNYKNSHHNPSIELEWYVRKLFEIMLYDSNNE